MTTGQTSKNPKEDFGSSAGYEEGSSFGLFSADWVVGLMALFHLQV